MSLKDRLIKLLGGYTRKEYSDFGYRSDLAADKKVAEREKIIEKLTSLAEQTPKGCIRGPWCLSCVFSGKTYVYTDKGYPWENSWQMTYCRRGEACPGLRLKEDT